MHTFSSISKRVLMVHLDTAKDWKLKLKTEKHCSKIIFKHVNSTVGPIFNEKVAEKRNLWIREQCTVCIDWLKIVWQVKLCGYCSAAAIVKFVPKRVKKKKKEQKNANANASAGPKRTLRVRLDIAENWKILNKIIFKCVNSTVGSIFNEKVVEKWNLWICEQCTVCTNWLKIVWQVKLCGYGSYTMYKQ